MIGIYGHVGHAVLRKMDNLRITVSSEVNPAQVPLHDLSEYSLVVADHHEFAGRLALGRFPGMLSVVVQDLSSVAIQTPAGEGVLQPQFAIQGVDGWADPLHRNTGLPERGQSIGLSKTDERHGSLMAVRWPNRSDDWFGHDDTVTSPAAPVPAGPGRAR